MPAFVSKFPYPLYYSAGPNPVCLNLSWINCTDAEVDDYLSRWQFPGQLPWLPVQPLGNYNVFPEQFAGYPTPIGLLYPGSGAIYVEYSDRTISNIGYPSHIFDGRVDRIPSRNANGVPQVTTHGYGTNTGFNLIETPIFSIGLSGPFIDDVNQRIAPYAFDAQDFGLIVYTTVVEGWQFASGSQQFPK